VSGVARRAVARGVLSFLLRGSTQTVATEVGHVPTFFVGTDTVREEVTPMDAQEAIERRVEAALARALPEVDLLEVTLAAGGMVRVVVDHPAGVDHGVCAEVTRVLDEDGLLDRHGVEVWSPGPEPPLRRPEHFRRAVGRRVRVKASGPDGSRSYTGTLVEADDRSLRLSLGAEVVQIPFSEVRRARALEGTGAAG
jgi:ribosome maturation factor RimP